MHLSVTVFVITLCFGSYMALGPSNLFYRHNYFGKKHTPLTTSRAWAPMTIPKPVNSEGAMTIPKPVNSEGARHKICQSCLEKPWEKAKKKTEDQNTGIPFNQDTIPSSFGSVKPIVGPLNFINSNRRVFPGDPSDYLETFKKLLSQGATSYNPPVQSPMGLQTQPSLLQNGYTPSSQNPIPAPPLYPDTRYFSNYKSGNNAATQSSNLPTQFNSDLLSNKKRDTTSDNSLAQSGSRQWNFLPKNDPLSSPGPISALPRNSNPQAFSYNNNNNAATQQSILQQSSNSDKPIVMDSKEAKKLYGRKPIPKDVTNAANDLMEKLANQKNPALPSQGDTNAQAFSENINRNNAPTKQSSLQNPLNSVL